MSMKLYNEDLLALINQCLEDTCQDSKAQYLINCLTLNAYKNLTIKEIFEKELEHRKWFEAEIQQRRNEIS